jgi:CheY-like chemotaxis protein
MTRVLVVDDEPQLLRTLALNLRARNYEVITASTAAEGIDHLPGLPPDVVILDLDLSDRDGRGIIRELHQREPTLPIVVLSPGSRRTPPNVAAPGRPERLRCHRTRDRDRARPGEAPGWAQVARTQQHPVGPSSSGAGGLCATTKAVCSR